MIDTLSTAWRPERGELCLPLAGAELYNATNLTLPVSSPLQTSARIALELLDADRSVVAGTTFALDWEGDNVIQLWPDTLEPRRGAPNRERLAAVTHLRLRQRSAGWWPTELGVGTPVLSDRAPAWQVNESDTVIEAGWHRIASHPLPWSLASDPGGPAPLLYSPYGEQTFDTGSGLRHAGTAPWLKFGYPMQERPGSLTVRRRFDLDVRGQREILAKLVWDRDTLLTVTATVDDGRTVFLCRDLEPDELWLTVGAPLDGTRHLHHVDVHIEEVPGRRVQSREVLVSLFWILLRRDSDLDRQPLNQVDVRLVRAHENHPDTVPTARRTVRQVPCDEPAESSTPIGDPLCDGLPFGFPGRPRRPPRPAGTGRRRPGGRPVRPHPRGGGPGARHRPGGPQLLRHGVRGRHRPAQGRDGRRHAPVRAHRRPDPSTHRRGALRGRGPALAAARRGRRGLARRPRRLRVTAERRGPAPVLGQLHRLVPARLRRLHEPSVHGRRRRLRSGSRVRHDLPRA